MKIDAMDKAGVLLPAEDCFTFPIPREMKLRSTCVFMVH
jgi:hypothetical protein